MDCIVAEGFGLEGDDDEDLPESIDAVLSRWWRSLSAPDRMCINSSNNLGSSLSPRSRTWALARTEDGKQFLEGRVDRLFSKLDACKRGTRDHVCHLLSLGYHLLWLPDRAKEALEQLRCAVDLASVFGGELEKAIHYTAARAEVQCAADLEREAAVARSPSASALPDFRAVKCVSVSELSDSLPVWQERGEPVLVKGLAWTMTSSPWSLEHVGEVAGKCTVELLTPAADSVQWAKLESSESSLVSEFIDRLLERKSATSVHRGDGSDRALAARSRGEDVEPSAKCKPVNADTSRQYLFDWSLPLNCPELAAEVTVPLGLADNWLSSLPEGTQYHSSWPSLFAAPGGLASGLHVDAFCSSFWMAVFDGTKRWTIFPRNETPLLYPVYPFSLDSAFPMDVTSWKDPASRLLRDHPALGLTHPWQVCVEPGDVLLVPWGCAHQVENVGTTLAISSNVITQHNAQKAIDWLRTQRLEDPNTEGILRALSSRLAAASESSATSKSSAFSEVPVVSGASGNG